LRQRFKLLSDEEGSYGGARIVDKFSKNGAAPCSCEQDGQYSLN